ncbi:MAG: DUF4829 domain-containing protein [Deltaproteobacteria bacterium]|jgi:hypothetical protein|nr:DUF4829 domain-containing protein [Deltaproteobacteria bacterium]
MTANRKALKKKAVWTILFLLLAGIGFAGSQYYLDNIKLPEVSPRQVVEQYFAAVKNRDYQKAYSLVSLRHYNNSYNQFIDRVSMYSPEMLLEIKGESIENDTAVVDARVVVPLQFGAYSSDSNMDLARVKREWKIIHP